MIYYTNKSILKFTMEFFFENDDIINSLDTEKGFYLTGR